MRDEDYPELGSGEVEFDPNRPIIHFGSPSGATYPEWSTREAASAKHRRRFRFAFRRPVTKPNS